MQRCATPRKAERGSQTGVTIWVIHVSNLTHHRMASWKMMHALVGQLVDQCRSYLILS